MLAERDIRGTVGQGLRDERIDRGLTPSQKAYCKGRAAGLRPLEAYRRAYPEDRSRPETLTGSALKLENDPRIVTFTTDLQVAAERQTNLVPQVERIEVSKDWVVQGIAQLAANPAIKPNVRLQAYIAVGKSAGVDAFREIIVHEKKSRTLEEIDAEIARHLANMKDVTPPAIGTAGSSSLPVIDQAPDAPPAGRDRRRKPASG